MTERATNSSNPSRLAVGNAMYSVFYQLHFHLAIVNYNHQQGHLLHRSFAPAMSVVTPGRKLLANSRRLSVSSVGFFAASYIVAVCFVLGLFVLIYGMWFMLQTFFR